MKNQRTAISYTNTAQSHITNEGGHGKYFHQMLNIYDDELDPYEYRLLGHYIRVTGAAKGVCWQSRRTVAEITKMSVGQVDKVSKRLQEKGWIRIEPGNRANTDRVTIIDRMEDNVTRYATGKGVHEVNTGVHEVNTGVHEVNTGVHEVNTGVHEVNTGVHEVNKRITLEEQLLRRVSEEEAAGAANPQKAGQFLSIEERLKAKNLIGGR